MNTTLIKAVILLAVASGLCAFAAFRHSRSKTRALFLQLTGLGCWILVALVHICEALTLFPVMGWGREDSVGHYLDLSSAVLGTGLLLAGLMLQMVTRYRG